MTFFWDAMPSGLVDTFLPNVGVLSTKLHNITSRNHHSHHKETLNLT